MTIFFLTFCVHYLSTYLPIIQFRLSPRNPNLVLVPSTLTLHCIVTWLHNSAYFSSMLEVCRIMQPCHDALPDSAAKITRLTTSFMRIEYSGILYLSIHHQESAISRAIFPVRQWRKLEEKLPRKNELFAKLLNLSELPNYIIYEIINCTAKFSLLRHILFYHVFDEKMIYLTVKNIASVLHFELLKEGILCDW